MRYALIGCGRIATNHVKAVINNNLELTAVCDVILDQMEKLLEKQKEGKKKMRTLGTVQLPSEAFMAVLKLDEE